MGRLSEWQVGQMTAEETTQAVTRLLDHLTSDQLLDAIAASELTAEDIANVVDFFLREQSAFVTGQNLYLGGIG